MNLPNFRMIGELIFSFFKNLFPIEAEQNILKKKQIELYGVNFKIIDVPHIILTTLKKSYKISSQFSMERASTYIKLVLKHNNIPSDFQSRLIMAACDSTTSQSETFECDNKTVLKIFFNNYNDSQINQAFQNNKKFLIDTFNYFKRQNPGRKLFNPNATSDIIRILDPIVSVQLDELCYEWNKERKKEEEEKEEEKAIEKAKKEGSFFECECCICEYPIDWMLRCPAGHLMCKKCVERQIETVISEGRSNVPCLKYGGCDEVISMSELERMIPKKVLERLITTETLNAINEAGIENTVTCHSCGFVVIMEGDGPMICPQCKSQTCPKCGEAWHQGMTCQQFKNIDKKRIVEEQMNEAVVRTCPNCKTQFIKNEGCNKMVCPRCKTWICYWCRKVIPKNVGYSHFWQGNGPCPPDKCPLWVQNNTLHLVEAEIAKTENSDNVQN